jgi:deoxyribodipyrimidine photolyase-like uncharacterized protein
LAINREIPGFVGLFVKECLHLFGSYQDAMTLTNGRYIIQNFVFDEYKMISPQVIDKAVNEWQNDQKNTI